MGIFPGIDLLKIGIYWDWTGQFDGDLMVEWDIHGYMFWNTTAQLYPIWVCLNLGDTPSWGNFEIDMQNLWFSKEHDLNMVNFPYIWTNAHDHSWDFYWLNPCWNCFDLNFRSYIFFSSKRLNHQVALSENVVYPMTQWFCWSLLNGYFIGNIPNIFRHTQVVVSKIWETHWHPWFLKTRLWPQRAPLDPMWPDSAWLATRWFDRIPRGMIRGW